MITQTEQTEISDLVDRYFRALDARRFTDGWADGFLTEDIRMQTPLGAARGADAVRATEEALRRYERTQHMASGIVADMDASTARVSWNALMVHVHHDGMLFMVGGRFEAGLRRVADGWRFSRMTVQAIWTQGQPPLGIGEPAARQPSATRVG
ncbi:nuclear transport factor 2 family protein [Streptomyces sp. NPDC048106]|uniref:nuclear transport factor 2 family protein n=1 Tax=Streptomyces sp. NPDC048106 TaxID=3155750 RepID=UPI003451BDFF